MSNNLSRTTEVIALRLPNEVMAILKRRAGKRDILVSDYLKRRVVFDTCRSHTRKERENDNQT